MKFVLAFLILITAVLARRSRYDNYKVYRLTPNTNKQLEALHELEKYSNFDFWKSPTTKHTSVDIMVPPCKIAQFKKFVKSLKIKFYKYIKNVQRRTSQTRQRSARFGGKLNWKNYFDGPAIEAWLRTLTKKYPKIVTKINIGKSYEGRNIVGVKVSYGPGKKGVFLEGGIHAREWISPATVTYILNQLLTSTNANVSDIAKSYDWYVFPNVNPDGYAYTQSHDRFWRKTRQPQGASCTGVDMNRNWNYKWMVAGGSNYSCSEIYAGPKPFSEPETKQLSKYISTIQQNLIGYIAFHSYSQYLLTPYGYTKAYLDNYDELLDIGKKAVTSLAKRFGTKYVVGSIVDVVYSASGGSMDWVKGTYKVPITYTYELRDNGRYGFLLPPKKILPTAKETLDSLVTIFQEAKSRGY